MTREITLTRGLKVLIDDNDYAAVRQHRWSVSGSLEKGLYAVAKIDGARVQMHRLLMDAPRHLVVDHINGQTLDNRRANLRCCTHSENLRNQARRATKGFKGVYRRASGWQTRLTVGGRNYTSTHETELGAARAYDLLAQEHFGEFARLNFSASRDWMFVSETGQ